MRLLLTALIVGVVAVSASAGDAVVTSETQQGKFELSQLEFAAGRIEEGISLERYFAPHLSSGSDQRVLDIGSGNGGVILPFANAGHASFAFDIVPNPDVRELTRLFHVPLKSVVGINGLPFADDSFALVLLLDVIEHVKDRAGLCREIMRVLQPGGKCMITTPPRLRYFLEPDPHFGVRSLVMLPNALQRFVVNRLAKRTVVGSDGSLHPAYDVEHIFWHVREVAGLFPGSKTVDVLFNRQLAPGKPFTREWFDFHLRDFFWDRIVITKHQGHRSFSRTLMNWPPSNWRFATATTSSFVMRKNEPW